MEKETKKLITPLTSIREELEQLNATIEVSKSSLSSFLPSNLKKIEEQVTQLSSLTLLLQSVPKNLSNELDKKTHMIAARINDINQENLTIFVESLTKKNREHHEAVKDIVSQLNNLKDDLKNAKVQQIKRYLIGLGITLILSALIAVGSSYAIMHFFPQKVNIDNPQKIGINNSDVGLWSSKNVQIKSDIKDYRR